MAAPMDVDACTALPTLPADVLREISLLLGARDLALFSAVCKQWRELAGERAWETLCSTRWGASGRGVMDVAVELQQGPQSNLSASPGQQQQQQRPFSWAGLYGRQHARDAAALQRVKDAMPWPHLREEVGCRPGPSHSSQTVKPLKNCMMHTSTLAQAACRSAETPAQPPHANHLCPAATSLSGCNPHPPMY